MSVLFTGVANDQLQVKKEKHIFWQKLASNPAANPSPASCVCLKPASPPHLPFFPVVSDRCSLLGHRSDRKEKIQLVSLALVCMARANYHTFYIDFIHHFLQGSIR